MLLALVGWLPSPLIVSMSSTGQGRPTEKLIGCLGDLKILHMNMMPSLKRERIEDLKGRLMNVAGTTISCEVLSAMHQHHLLVCMNGHCSGTVIAVSLDVDA